MSATQCPRCGNKIAPKYRFCWECGFPVWEADQVSDNLTNQPVPFRLSEEHRRFYAASEASDAAGDSAERTPNKTGKTYLVTVENGIGGGCYLPGEKVLITAVVPKDSEFDFSGWEITEGDVILSNWMLETACFIMPKANVSITARLSDIKYTVTVTNGEGGGKYSAGDKVTLIADKPKGDYVFEGWEIKNGDMFLSDSRSETACFFMPRGDVEILAVFREKRTLILTVKNGTAGAKELHAGETTVITADAADNGYIFAGWTIEGEATVENPHKKQTTLTIESGDVIAVANYDVIPVLKPGDELHDIFLELADSVENGKKIDYDQKIKRFGRSDTGPSERTRTRNISETGRAVQTWYDNSDGTIYWYTDVEKVRLNENSDGMFRGYRALRKVDFTGIDTGNVTNTSYMFIDCSSLTSLNLSSFDTANVTDMGCMFRECRSLTSLDLSNFITRNVKRMDGMFWRCTSLTSLDLSGFDAENVKYMGSMFSYCNNLTDLKTKDKKILREYSRR